MFSKKVATVLVAALLVLSVVHADVVELNAKNFDSIVKDPKKDVLVMFYAPWCGHCNAMKPTYQDLGKGYPASGDVIVARIDADANRAVGGKYGVQGFPTIKMFTKKDKTGNIDYSGPRTKSAFESFIREHTS